MILSVSGSGVDRFFWGFPAEGRASAMRRLEAEDIDLIKRSAWVHISGSGLGEVDLREMLLGAMQEARKHEVPVSLDLK